jgi:hypothetical protein
MYIRCALSLLEAAIQFTAVCLLPLVYKCKYKIIQNYNFICCVTWVRRSVMHLSEDHRLTAFENEPLRTGWTSLIQ